MKNCLIIYDGRSDVWDLSTMALETVREDLPAIHLDNDNNMFVHASAYEAAIKAKMHRVVEENF